MICIDRKSAGNYDDVMDSFVVLLFKSNDLHEFLELLGRQHKGNRYERNQGGAKTVDQWLVARRCNGEK